MKRILKLIFCMLMILSAAGTALADGDGEWVYSKLHGWVQLASYVGEYDGYVSADGYGGVTSADPYYVTVISKSASVWAESRTNSKKLGSAAHGKSLMCRSSDGGESLVYENGFYGVELNGKDGWVNEDYVILNELTITLLESNVPAYIAPDTASKKVGSLSKLTEYRVIGFYDNFYIVNLRDAAAAFIPMSVKHLDNTFNRNYRGGGYHEQAVTAGKVTLRTGPGSEYPQIRMLKAGETVSIMDVIDNWYMIYDDETLNYAFIAPEDLDVNL